MNNAGAMFDRRATTVDGLELTFATNHLAYFVMTHLLRDRLLAADQGRVVNTSSDAHRGTALDFSDLQSANGYGGFKAYQRSKLCNILFTRELARQFKGTKVTANALHPGFVNTRFGDNNKGLLTKGFLLAKRFAISPEEGARTLIYLASSDQVEKSTGEYFYKCRPKEPTKEAQDDNSARRLWQETLQLCGMESRRVSV
jgi:NAD(P)-dependent dehydrogenase (short-subunit alcohol dehydrogenase family)